MHWVVLAIGIVLGGILRLLYDKKKNRTAQTSKWIMIILTSCIFAGISWGFGALISLLSEKLHKGGKEKKSKKG